MTPTLRERRAVADGITAVLRTGGNDDPRGALAKPDTSILVVYGEGLGDFQTISFDQAREYLRLLAEGQAGPPWKLGIR